MEKGKWKTAGVGLLLLLSACSNDVKPEDVALQAAKAYYDQLLQGDYDAFVEGTLHGDTIPEEYRRQLVLNMQMYVEQQQKAHKGITSVSALRATADTASHTASAFLAISYADSVKEQVVVPMIEKNGVWYLR